MGMGMCPMPCVARAGGGVLVSGLLVGCLLCVGCLVFV